MPLDQMENTVLDRSDFGSTQDYSTEATEMRETRAPAAMIQLSRARAIARARHADLLKFRRTWGGAINDPAEDGKADE